MLICSSNEKNNKCQNTPSQNNKKQTEDIKIEGVRIDFEKFEYIIAIREVLETLRVAWFIAFHVFHAVKLIYQ